MLGSEPYLFTGDLTKVVWARAMNTKGLLSKALYDARINMIELDIVMGTKIDGPHDRLVPIVAHPPENKSELDVEELFSTVIPLIEDIGTPKGLKMDFKSKEAFAKSLPALRMAFSIRKKDFPIWLNADVLSGPGMRSEQPVDATFFITEAAKFPKVVISLGWNSLIPSDETSYSSVDIDAMLSLLHKFKCRQPYTICIRATLIETSYDLIIRLIRGAKSDTTLTVWCYSNDRPEVTSIKKLLKEVGHKKVYLDVPQAVFEKLSLDK